MRLPPCRCTLPLPKMPAMAAARLPAAPPGQLKPLTSCSRREQLIADNQRLCGCRQSGVEPSAAGAEKRATDTVVVTFQRMITQMLLQMQEWPSNSAQLLLNARGALCRNGFATQLLQAAL